MSFRLAGTFGAAFVGTLAGIINCPALAHGVLSSSSTCSCLGGGGIESRSVARRFSNAVSAEDALDPPACDPATLLRFSALVMSSMENTVGSSTGGTSPSGVVGECSAAISVDGKSAAESVLDLRNKRRSRLSP
eukprot:4397119-Amphidinium_carterae.1